MAIGIAPSSGFVSARNDELSLSELTKALHTMALEVVLVAGRLRAGNGKSDEVHCCSERWIWFWHDHLG